MAEETIRARAEHYLKLKTSKWNAMPERLRYGVLLWEIDVVHDLLQALTEAEARATTAEQVTILDRLPDGRPRPSVSMYNHAVDVANANYRRAEATESQLRSLQDQQETLRQEIVRLTTERDGARLAYRGLADSMADPAPSAPPRPLEVRCPLCNGTGEDSEYGGDDQWHRARCSGCRGTGTQPINAPPRPEGWQPIASAPKGQPVLLWLRDGDAILGSFVQFDGEPPKGYHNGWCNGWNGRYLETDDQPTHWMPLPAPPPVVPPTLEEKNDEKNVGS